MRYAIDVLARFFMAQTYNPHDRKMQRVRQFLGDPRFLKRPILAPQPLAYIGDALLGIRLGRGRWLRGRLNWR